MDSEPCGIQGCRHDKHSVCTVPHWAPLCLAGAQQAQCLILAASFTLSHLRRIHFAEHHVLPAV